MVIGIEDNLAAVVSEAAKVFASDCARDVVFYRRTRCNVDLVGIRVVGV